jgi:ABC-type sugar transport system ATPase subunit
MTQHRPTESEEPLLRLRGISKGFPGVQALQDVDLEVRRGEAHAVCGENGAGKSTLMHILAGVHGPDAGTIDFDGRRVCFENEHDAQSAGISMVYQELSLIDTLSVAENVFAGRQPLNRWGLIDSRALRRRTAEILAELNQQLDPGTPVAALSPAIRQMVEIARALSLDARLLVLDEPTSSLTRSETEALFRTIAAMKHRGVGVIYISHRLEEVFRVADRVTVLKDGANAGTFATRDVSQDTLIAAMVGRAAPEGQRPNGKALDPAAPPALEVRGLSDGRRVHGVSFSIRAGEIVGFAGLAGAGRTEMAMAIFGAAPGGSGHIWIGGKPAVIRSPADAIRAGIGYIPEDRREAALFLDMSVAENVAASRNRGWLWDRRAQHATANEFRERLAIRTPSVGQVVANLSGGNQQKVVLARWLQSNLKVLIADEPTRGVDVGAKAEMHELFRRLAAQGTAIVLISSEMPELLALADRILVMQQGRVSGELDAKQATEETILQYAAGTVER